MKRYASIVIVLAVILGGIIFTRSHSVEYVAPETQVVEKEVHVPEIEKRTKDAITASSTEIEQAMSKASQRAKEEMETEIKLNVNRQLQKELKEQESKLEEQVSL